MSVEIEQDQNIDFIDSRIKKQEVTGEEQEGTGKRHYNRTMDGRQAAHMVPFCSDQRGGGERQHFPSEWCSSYVAAPQQDGAELEDFDKTL